MVNQCLLFIQRLLYPHHCLLCGATGDSGLDLCIHCLHELPYNRHCCQRCALPLPASDHSGYCGACLLKPPPFHRAVVPLLYRPPIDYLVAGFKFNGRLNHGGLLASLLISRLHQEAGPLPELLMPVPLHRSRVRQRGFNQALELARPISRTLQIPIDTSIVVRNRATSAQSGLEKQQRLRNLRGVFHIRKPIRVRHLAILDDVVTTGATASALARLLLQNGAERVDLWAVARTP